MSKAIFFDLDGTLTDSGEGIINCAAFALETLGLDVPDRVTMRCFVGPPLRDTFMKFGVREDQTEEAIRIYRSRYLPIGKYENKPYPGVIDLIDRLETAGIRTAVVSNKPNGATVKLCAKYFPGIGVVGGERESEGVRRKPWPDMVFRAVEEMGLTPSDCVYIGDSEVDVLTAKNAGMDCITVLWGFRDREDLEREGASCFAETADRVFELIAGESF